MYLGIDIGTSGVKVVLLDNQQQVIASADATLTLQQPKPLWSEQHPEDWWQATCDAVMSLKQNHSELLAKIAAIGLSGQMHGAVLLDSHDQVLRPAILWNDGRSAPQCLELKSRVPEVEEITGNLVMPAFTAPKLLWVKQHEPDVFNQIAKVLLPKDYIRMRLSGDYATDMSDASGTSWLNVAERKWSQPLVAACDLTLEQLPELFEGNEVTGQIKPEIAAQLGINPQANIVAGAGDNAASALGMSVVNDGQALLSLGTSGVYFVAQQKYRANPSQAVHTYCHCLPNRWHQMSVHLSAASCLSWWGNIHTDLSIEQLVAESEVRLADNALPIFLPYLSGERTPHNDPYAQGVFMGLTHSTDRPAMTQSVLEGVAFALLSGQNAIQTAGTTINDVLVVGGGAKSQYWGKIIASILKQNLHYTQEASLGAALGAAKLAWLSEHSLDALTAPECQHTIQPIDDTETLFQRYDQFTELYQALKPIYQQFYQN